MKRFLLFIAVISMLQISCEKSEPEVAKHPIEGKWKMIEVKDNATNISTTRASVSITGDVILNITVVNESTYGFTGNTPTNEIFQSYFMAFGNNMLFDALSMTKVAETAWGSFFIDHIRYAERYNIQSGRLSILTLEKTLVFIKLQ